MRKFCNFRSAPILRLGFLGGHLCPKSQHGRRLFAPHHTPTVFLVLRTALHLQRTNLTILLLRLVFENVRPFLSRFPSYFNRLPFVHPQQFCSAAVIHLLTGTRTWPAVRF